jgi:hypothetical protein
MLGKLLLPEVRDLIASGDEKTLSEVLNRWSPADVVELFDALSDDEDLAGMKMMSGPQRARVFEYLDRRSQKHLLLFSCWDRPMGNLGRSDASIRIEAIWIGPGDVVRTTRSNLGGCHRPYYLFFRGYRIASRYTALKKL